jgi:two-component system chemotaxis response regulator CheY
MPKMSGLELLKTVRNDENLKDIPFIMVTAEAQKENILEAIKYKVNQYIVKPFTPEILKEKLEKVFGS